MTHTLRLILSSLMLIACQPAGSNPVNSQPVQTTPNPEPDPTQARSANDFVDSIGVNTHVSYTDTAYGQYETLLKPSLTYLGVRHIRDGITDASNSLVLRRYRDLHSNSIRITAVVPYKTTSMPDLIAMIKTQLEVVNDSIKDEIPKDHASI